MPYFLEALTPCFMMSLAWLATSFTITRAAEWTKMWKSDMRWKPFSSVCKLKTLFYLVCPCNLLSLLTGFWDSLEHSYNHLRSRIKSQASELVSTLGCKRSVWWSKFLERNLKLKSWTKRSAGAYIIQLYKSDAGNILHIAVLGGSTLIHQTHETLISLMLKLMLCH